MNFSRLRRPQLLVSLGLFGMAALVIAERFEPSLLSQDFTRGLGAGVCLGLELVGLILLKRPKTPRLCPIPLRVDLNRRDRRS